MAIPSPRRRFYDHCDLRAADLPHLVLENHKNLICLLFSLEDYVSNR